jgi:hypothetical protein
MPHRNQKIFNEGWLAWTDGASIFDNPYANQDYPTENYGAWEDGWCAAQEDQEEQDKEADRGDWEFHQRHDD